MPQSSGSFKIDFPQIVKSPTPTPEEPPKTAPAFGFGSMSPITFGSGTPSMDASSNADDEDNVAKDDEPGVELGQSDVDELYHTKAKISRKCIDESGKAKWDTVGVGIFRIEQFKDDKTYRVILVLENGLVMLNSRVVKYKIDMNGDKALVFCAEYEQKPCLYLAQVSSKETAKELFDKLNAIIS